ncbi:MAG: transcriptional repressor, partial [Clostridia bacterium]|nr:transcriptional repressor [Clostridia bacterium]
METTSKQFRKRNAILTCLRQTCTHPSAEDVHRMLQAEHPDISLATVYRNLSLFKKQGVIQSLGTVNGIERFDANTEPHVHFVCTGCDAVM